jgi:hypothetical protein
MRESCRHEWMAKCEFWDTLRRAYEGGGAVMVNDEGSTFVATTPAMVKHYEAKGLWRSSDAMAEHTLAKGPPTFEEHWQAERQHLEAKAASDAAWE